MSIFKCRLFSADILNFLIIFNTSYIYKTLLYYKTCYHSQKKNHHKIQYFKCVECTNVTLIYFIILIFIMLKSISFYFLYKGIKIIEYWWKKINFSMKIFLFITNNSAMFLMYSKMFSNAEYIFSAKHILKYVLKMLNINNVCLQ